MKIFWSGFHKRADASTGGGGFFSGIGKGNLPTGYAEQGQLTGPIPAGPDSGMTDKMLLDRQRNPKDFSVRELGEDAPSEAVPHIIY